MSATDTRAFEQAAHYGQGVALRRIRLTTSPGVALAEMEDHAHAMRCRIHHAAGRITAVDSEFLRYPLTTCPGAETVLRELVGEPINVSAREFFGGGKARRNCTHMFDLAWLAARHATRQDTVRDYLMTIPDAPQGHGEAVLRRDGDILLRWHLQDDVIVDPAPFVGRHLYRGFVSWALIAPELDPDGR